jgi:hypothetical protein
MSCPELPKRSRNIPRKKYKKREKHPKKKGQPNHAKTLG